MTELTHAFILHRRAFRESSLIVDLLTLEKGLISAVAKGAKRPKSSFRSSLQFFTELHASFYGRSEMLGLKSAEPKGSITILAGEYLFAALYANELICKLLHKHEAHPMIYSAYADLMLAFTQALPLEAALRTFEMILLEGLGYGLNFNNESLSQENAEHHYFQFVLEEGFVQAADQTVTQTKYLISGKYLLKMQQRQFYEADVLAAAKKLFRIIFGELLMHKPIHSRQLFTFKTRSVSPGLK